MSADSAVPLCTGHQRERPKAQIYAEYAKICLDSKAAVRDGAVVHGFQCYRRTRRPSISYLQEHGLDLGISCQIKAISEWKLDLMASKVFQNLTFDKGKTVKEVYRILNRCMAEEKTVRISKKAMLENSIAKQKERLGRYIDLCADGVITKQELVDRRKGLDARIAELQSQYESIAVGALI